jgi:hypothetical protein
MLRACRRIFCRQLGSAEQSDPQALQWVSPQRALRLASSIGGLAYGGTDRLIFGALSHEQIGKNEGICHHKMATKQDSTG